MFGQSAPCEGCAGPASRRIRLSLIAVLALRGVVAGRGPHIALSKEVCAVQSLLRHREAWCRWPRREAAQRADQAEEVIAKLLSSRALVHSATVPGGLSQLSEAHRRLRSRDSPLRQPGAPSDEAPKTQPNQPSPEGVLRPELKRVFGIDLTRIPGMHVGIARTLFGEIGPHFMKFRSPVGSKFYGSAHGRT